MKKYKIFLTEKEMQMLANGIAAFYNVMNQEKRAIDPAQSAILTNVMEKFKKAIDDRPQGDVEIYTL